MSIVLFGFSLSCVAKERDLESSVKSLKVLDKVFFVPLEVDVLSD